MYIVQYSLCTGIQFSAFHEMLPVRAQGSSECWATSQQRACHLNLPPSCTGLSVCTSVSPSPLPPVSQPIQQKELPRPASFQERSGNVVWPRGPAVPLSSPPSLPLRPLLPSSSPSHDPSLSALSYPKPSRLHTAHYPSAGAVFTDTPSSDTCRVPHYTHFHGMYHRYQILVPSVSSGGFSFFPLEIKMGDGLPWFRGKSAGSGGE